MAKYLTKFDNDAQYKEAESGLILPNVSLCVEEEHVHYNPYIPPPPMYVDLGLPSGVKWSKANIDLTTNTGFADSPFQYECSFFSWGNTFMKNPTSTTAFDYDWGILNSGPYATTPGASITAATYPTTGSTVTPGQDVATVNLGDPWRLPTATEFKELIDNCTFIDANGNAVTGTNKLVTVNGVVGIYLKSNTNNNTIFFSCSGYGYESAWTTSGAHGYYWSSSLYNKLYGRNLVFSSGGVNPQDNYRRFCGFSARAVSS